MKPLAFYDYWNLSKLILTKGKRYERETWQPTNGLRDELITEANTNCVYKIGGRLYACFNYAASISVFFWDKRSDSPLPPFLISHPHITGTLVYVPPSSLTSLDRDLYLHSSLRRHVLGIDCNSRLVPQSTRKFLPDVPHYWQGAPSTHNPHGYSRCSWLLDIKNMGCDHTVSLEDDHPIANRASHLMYIYAQNMSRVDCPEEHLALPHMDWHPVGRAVLTQARLLAKALPKRQFLVLPSIRHRHWNRDWIGSVTVQCTETGKCYEGNVTTKHSPKELRLMREDAIGWAMNNLYVPGPDA